MKSINIEVTIQKLKDNGKRYKVTKRVPGLKTAQTKMFKIKEEAIKQFREWSN